MAPATGRIPRRIVRALDGYRLELIELPAAERPPTFAAGAAQQFRQPAQ